MISVRYYSLFVAILVLASLQAASLSLSCQPVDEAVAVSSNNVAHADKVREFAGSLVRDIYTKALSAFAHLHLRLAYSTTSVTRASNKLPADLRLSHDVLSASLVLACCIVVYHQISLDERSMLANARKQEDARAIRSNYEQITLLPPSIYRHAIGQGNVALTVAKVSACSIRVVCGDFRCAKQRR
jgi:hypothetical protein